MELVGVKPLHLLTQTALPLKSPTGAFIAAQTRTFLKPIFTGEVVEGNGSCSAAFYESAALRNTIFSRENGIAERQQAFRYPENIK